MTLTQKTIPEIRSFFEDSKTYPSDEMWKGIADVAHTLESMAEGNLEPKTYLSRLDPGVGKTTTATRFIRQLLASPAHKHVSVLYCVSRIDEMPRIIADIGNGVAVYTSDEAFDNATGTIPREDRWNARVLLTTQQMVNSRLSKAPTFSELSEFHYLGRPRQIRVWDEALAIAEEVTLNVNTLSELASYLHLIDLRIPDRIHDLVEDIRSIKGRKLYSFPDLVAEFKLDYDRVRHLLRNALDRVKHAARAIFLVSGKEVAVRKDIYGQTMLDYKDSLPGDFFPVLVLDASGRVRGTYALWAEYRKNLEFLEEAPKFYHNLGVNLWNRGGGKFIWRTDSATLLEGIIKTIDSKPDERWLLIVHKEDDWQDKKSRNIPNLEDTIKKQVSNQKT